MRTNGGGQNEQRGDLTSSRCPTPCPSHSICQQAARVPKAQGSSPYTIYWLHTHSVVVFWTHLHLQFTAVKNNQRMTRPLLRLLVRESLRAAHFSTLACRIHTLGGAATSLMMVFCLNENPGFQENEYIASRHKPAEPQRTPSPHLTHILQPAMQLS